MNKLFKSGGMGSPKKLLERMSVGGFEYVTWANSMAGSRFIARKSYIEKKAFNKSCLKRSERVLINDGEVVKLGANLNVDEILFELDANNVNEIQIQENKTKTNINRNSLNAISEVMYNEKFDCSVFWA